MKPHPDFAGLEMPQSVRLGPFRLDILTARDLDEDFAAVIGATRVLQGLFGPTWPVGLTRDANALDLHWHHREFLARRSFAWGVRSEAGAYEGCAYLSADIGARGSGEAAYWTTDRPDRQTWLGTFGALYVDWLRGQIPDGFDLAVTNNAKIGQNLPRDS